MSTTWHLRFEGLPPNQNGRQFYHDKAKVVARYRFLAAIEAKRAGIPACARIRVSAVVTRRALGVADEPGDWERCKACVDGLTDAGVVPKDTRAYVEYGRCLEEHGPPGVTLIIEALEGENA